MIVWCGLVFASQGAFNLSAVAFWTTLSFVGIAWTRTDVYPEWSSWPRIFLAIVSVAVAVLRLTVAASAGYDRCIPYHSRRHLGHRLGHATCEEALVIGARPRADRPGGVMPAVSPVGDSPNRISPKHC